MPVKKIIYSKQALELFQSEIDKFGTIETGGALMGSIDNNIIVIEKACNGGPNAIHEQIYFRADPNYIDMFIDLEFANSGGRLRYIGEWHSHPQIVPEPSMKDLNSLSEIAESSDDFCLLLIIGAINFNIDLFMNQSISIIKFKGIEQFYSLPSGINH